MAQKLELTHSAALSIKKDSRVFSAFGALGFQAEDKYFASSEGSSIQQYVVRSFPLLSAVAVDFQNGISRTRNYTVEPQTAGWETIAKANLGENAPRIRAEVLEHLAAPPVKPGKKDLVLLPSHLWLTIHEIHRPLNRTRSRTGIRSQLRRHKLSHDREDGQILSRERTDQRLRRPHH